jgi:hypothetical protein
LTIEPNTELILTWQVRNATTKDISRTSAVGPGGPEYVDPSGNILDLGAFTGTQSADATYKLTATNQCASVTSTVSVHLHVRRLSFATDIRPLFRDKDIEAMRPRGLDLSSYQDVKQNAQEIYLVLHPTQSFTMPCDGPWPADWVATFKLWMDQGMAP